MRHAVNILRAGGAVVFPTDTAYALGVDATNTRAVKQLFRIKKRKPTKPVHVVVADLKMAKKYARFTSSEEKLFKKFLPGPLTLILNLKNNPSQLPLSLRGGVPPLKLRGGEGELLALKILSAGTGTIGIRMPKNRMALELVKKFGRPITATSANVSGTPTAYSVAQIMRQYRGAKFLPDLILGGGKLPRVAPSTMVQLRGNQIDIVRRGPITKTQLINALKL